MSFLGLVSKKKHDEAIKNIESKFSAKAREASDLFEQNRSLKSSFDRVQNSLERLLSNYDLSLILSEIVNQFFKKEDGFVHPEINVLTYKAWNLKGLPYKEFCKTSVEDLIDNNYSKFSKEDLKLLDVDIKQTIYLLLNSGKQVHVKDGANSGEIIAAYKPIFDQLSESEVRASIDDKIDKTKKFGIKEHISIPLITTKIIDKDVKEERLIGYIHAPTNTYHTWNHSQAFRTGSLVATLAIHNYFNHQRKENAINADLKNAAEIQKLSMPTGAVSFKGLDVAWKYFPTSKIGGDYFNMVPLSDSKVAFYMGDAAGHGVGAALIQFLSSYISERALRNSTSLKPSSILLELNDELHRYIGDKDKDSCRFVTSFLGIFDIKNNSFDFCSAGHPHPYIVRNGSLDEIACREWDASKNEERTFNGMMLGAYHSSEMTGKGILRDDKLDLKQGDRIVFYTDGIVEARNMEKVCYDKRFSSLVESSKDMRPNDFINYVFDDLVRNFRSSRAMDDDATLVVIDVDK